MGVNKSIKFGFPITNNVAEYKALISRLKLARNVNIRSLSVYNDSNLLVQQMNKEYEVRDAMLQKYV